MSVSKTFKISVNIFRNITQTKFSACEIYLYPFLWIKKFFLWYKSNKTTEVRVVKMINIMRHWKCPKLN